MNNTLDIIAELVETGADVLSSAELNKLQQEGKQLKVRYDNVSNNSDKLLKRLVSAHEELLKFNSEVTAFRSVDIYHLKLLLYLIKNTFSYFKWKVFINSNQQFKVK